MPGQPLLPETTLVVILGASAWPLSPKLPASDAFSNSAADLRRYLTDPKLFNLPDDNLHLLNLFDDAGSPLDVNRQLSTWLQGAQAAATRASKPARDLIVYYVGHGGFTPGGEQAYFLALRSTETNNEGISSFRMTDLARTINREAKSLRRFLILDCCFAESAYELFQSNGGDPANVAHAKALMDFPVRGTALMCSSSARDVSITPKGERYTMFSGALLEVLRSGDATIATPLSLEHVGTRVARLITEKYPEIAVRPKVSSPDEREGDIADLPVFPNAALLSRPVEEGLLAEESVDSLETSEHEEAENNQAGETWDQQLKGHLLSSDPEQYLSDVDQLCNEHHEEYIAKRHSILASINWTKRIDGNVTDLAPRYVNHLKVLGGHVFTNDSSKSLFFEWRMERRRYKGIVMYRTCFLGPGESRFVYSSYVDPPSRIKLWVGRRRD